MTAAQPTALILRLDTWPEADRAAWQRAATPVRTPFRRDAGVPRNPFTLRNTAAGYGRWLGYLSGQGLLDARGPADRITPERLDGYFEHLVACGNADHTIYGRFSGLRRALRFLCPGVDFAWVMKPGGRSWRDLLEMRTRARFVPSDEELLEWAETIFRGGLKSHKNRVRKAAVREATMIAMLATRGPRLRALSSLRLGKHLEKFGEEWFLDQDGNIMKMGRSLGMPLSAEVVAILERYLAVERPELLGAQDHDALWVAQGGGPLNRETISRRMQLLSLRRFGVAFGPHRARASIATTIAIESPEMPLDASAILGHASAQVTLSHYNKAAGIAASRRHGDRLAQLRSRSAPLARRLWERHDRDD